MVRGEGQGEMVGMGLEVWVLRRIQLWAGGALELERAEVNPRRLTARA